MRKLKSFRTTYNDFNVIDNSQGYTITKHIAGEIGSKTLNFKYGINQDDIITSFRTLEDKGYF